MKRHLAAAFVGGATALALGLYWAGRELGRHAEGMFELDRRLVRDAARDHGGWCRRSPRSTTPLCQCAPGTCDIGFPLGFPE